MRAYWTLMRRELAGFFCSVTGYLIIAAVAFLIGASFYLLIRNAQGELLTAPVTEIFYSTAYFWFFIFLPPISIVTMRLFAQEKINQLMEFCS